MNKEDLREIFTCHCQLVEESFTQLGDSIIEAGQRLSNCLHTGGKILLCGNGGSAADAQHFAAELVNRFLHDRPALPAIALTTDSSAITAIANDHSYERIFARQIEALGDEADYLVLMTTSGNSANLVHAVESAYEKKMEVLLLSGKDGGSLAGVLREGTLELRVPAEQTPRIQEVHILIIHYLCYAIERELFL